MTLGPSLLPGSLQGGQSTCETTVFLQESKLLGIHHGDGELTMAPGERAPPPPSSIPSAVLHHVYPFVSTTLRPSMSTCGATLPACTGQCLATSSLFQLLPSVGRIFPSFLWSPEPPTRLQPTGSAPSVSLLGPRESIFPIASSPRVVPASASKALTFAIEKAQGDRWEAHN